MKTITNEEKIAYLASAQRRVNKLQKKQLNSSNVTKRNIVLKINATFDAMFYLHNNVSIYFL